MFKQPETADIFIQAPARQALADCCTRCGACVSQCPFLSQYGSPGQLADQYEANPDSCRSLAFECSLCGRCSVVCPKHLDPSAMFLEWRQQALASGKKDLTPYKTILGYEKRGCSKLFSFYSLPRNCDTIFFPGCTLAGTRPDITLKAYEYLAARLPNAGIVLDCCTKPSRDIGRKNFFEAMISEMTGFLADNHITTIVTACPSCQKIFHAHTPFRVKSLYEIMARDPGFQKDGDKGQGPRPKVIVQDPCQARFDTVSQTAVRTLSTALGMEIIRSGPTREKTFCCGEGASVGCAAPDTAMAWTRKRKKAARGLDSITYCAGCVDRLSGPGRNFHILDLAFGREHLFEKGARISRAPFTYWNRLRLKKKLAALSHPLTREREFFYGKTGNRPTQKQFISWLALGMAVLAAAAFI